MGVTRTGAPFAVLLLGAAAAAACAGAAGQHGHVAPPDVRIGTFTRQTIGSLANLLSREPLVAIDWDGRPANRLAESSHESADGRVLTATLRPNVRFHNGEPLSGARARQLLSQKTALMKLVEAIDVSGRTLSIRLKRPHALRLVDLSEYAVADDSDVSVRTGPFKIVSSAPLVVLERFEQYYQGLPSVARVEIREYPNHRAAWTAMMRGEVNFLHEVSRDAVQFIQAGGNVRAYPTLRPYYYSLVFNQRHRVLHRREVRIALNEAVDRDEIVANGMRGHGRVAESPFWPYHWAVPEGRTGSSYNPEAAKVRLEAAGLTVASRERSAMPSRFAFTCLVPAGDARFERIALVVQRQLSVVGVDMRLEAVPLEQLPGRLRAGKFDAFLFELASARSLVWPYEWWRSGMTEHISTGYAGADAAFDRMRAASSDEEVRIAVADVMRALRDDPPALFLVWAYDARAVDNALIIPYEPERDIFGTLWQAERAPATASLR